MPQMWPRVFALYVDVLLLPDTDDHGMADIDMDIDTINLYRE